MPVTVAEVNAVVERLWPLGGAEAWDAPGFLVGEPGASVSSIHLAVDAVAESIDEAIDMGADLLLVHHPLLLRGVTSVAEDRYKGAMVGRLIRAGCALVAAHTNADVVEQGTSGVLASLLGLREATPIVVASDPQLGIGRVGVLAEATSLGHLARQLAELLPPTASGVRVAGDYNQPVHRVALCGGAGDSLLNEPAVLGADVYVTSDLRHHPASESRANSAISGGPALIDVSHWASEWLWLETAADQLRDALPEVTVTVSDLRTDPWDFAIVQ